MQHSGVGGWPSWGMKAFRSRSFAGSTSTLLCYSDRELAGVVGLKIREFHDEFGAPRALRAM